MTKSTQLGSHFRESSSYDSRYLICPPNGLFFQLRQLRSISRSLTTQATRASVQAFVSCRLDYCNSLLAGVAEVHLQSVRNADAARLVSDARLYDHITLSVLATLHRLPIRQRVVFKTTVLLHDKAPRYMAVRSAYAAVNYRRPGLSSRCSPCLELSAAARRVCTVSFHFPKPSEDSPLQPLLSSCQAREVIPSLRPFHLLLLLSATLHG